MATTSLNPNSNPIKLKITLEQIDFLISRKILVPEEIDMMQLHIAIQIAMGWEMSHLFEFKDKEYRNEISILESFDDDMDDMFPGRRVRTFKPELVSLKKEFIENRGGKPFYYLYDFGDSWLHKISFLKPTKKDLEQYNGDPICVEASGACPPEDVGGTWGYMEFLDAINDKKHPEYDDYRDWLELKKGEKYDPEFVDISRANYALRQLKI